jgi:hypothetical protein
MGVSLAIQSRTLVVFEKAEARIKP